MMNPLVTSLRKSASLVSVLLLAQIAFYHAKPVSADSPTSSNMCNVQDNVVQNCGFDDSTGNTQGNNPPHYTLGGPATTALITPATSAGATGNALAFLSKTSQDATASQQLQLEPDATYQVSFDVAIASFQDPQSPFAGVHARVLIGRLFLFSFDEGQETNNAGQTPITQPNQFYHRSYTIVANQGSSGNIAATGRSTFDPIYFDNFVVVKTADAPVSSSTGSAASSTGFELALTGPTGPIAIPLPDESSTGLAAAIAPSSTAAVVEMSSTASTVATPVSSSTAPSTAPVVASTGTPVPTSASTAPSGVVGDPQFTGFLGQSYQVHGSSDIVYNVISSRHLQYNALFSYLDHGSCRKGTECFAHPGNYFGQVGVLIKNDGVGSASDKSMSYHSSKFVDAHAGGGSTRDGHDEQLGVADPISHGDHADLQLTITAGAVDDGMSVVMGNSTLRPSNRHIQLSSQSSVFFPSRFELYIETVDFTIKLENSDMFLNQAVSINDDLVKQIRQFQASADTSSGDKSSGAKSQLSVNDLPHGILGQTWQMKQYDNKWKYVQGTLQEYIVADGVTGTNFKYNRFD